ncbi:MAG: GspE/PulE family protein [Bacteroidota bacterium]
MIDIATIDFRMLSRLSPMQAHKFRVVPIGEREDGIILASDAAQQANTAALQLLLGQTVALAPQPTDQLEKMLLKHYPSVPRSGKAKSTTEANESDVVRFVDKVLDAAQSIGASDIHIERYETEARIRFRWEGQLIEKYEVPLEQYNALVSRIKILAELDISERRLPQDGRIHLKIKEKEIDIRVSSLPGKYGEKVVLRLLTRSQEHLSLQNLPFQDGSRARFMNAIQSPNGIVLITGPTGSGKTTTLYAALSHLNQPQKNILTIEDPIEYNLSGINQVQLKEEIGLSFDRALRAFLRQDPDIIMVGEIRDTPTAQIAIRAALTGHLVFSTLHTNSAWDAISRLVDMGVEPYLLAASLRLVVAQRLVRKLCPKCKIASDEIIIAPFQERYNIHHHYLSQGCEHCYYTGYRGRQAVFEVLPVEATLKEMIKAKEDNIEAYLAQQQVPSLADNLKALVERGQTSLAEAFNHIRV